MTKKDKQNILNTAKTILHWWQDCIDRSHGDWFEHGKRQAYSDALECMKRNNLIKDYKLPDQIIG